MDKQIQKLGFAGKLARTFVMNSRLSILLIISVFAWGLVSFVLTPKQYNPEIVAPAFQVITNFPGASNVEIQELVTNPLENIIMDIDGVDEIMSQSIDGGVSIVMVQFFVGNDIEESKIVLMQKINGNMDKIPAGVQPPLIKEINPDDVPILTIALSNNNLSLSVLRKLAIDVRDEIKNVSNTSNISIHGGLVKQAKVLLDPKKLVAQNISILQVLDSIKKNNQSVIVGELDMGDKDIDVKLDAKIYNTNDLKNIVISTSANDLVYLEDVAEVVYESAEVEDSILLRHPDSKDTNTVFLSVAKKKGSNITVVSDAVQDKLKDLGNTLIPPSVDVEIVRDEGKTASEEINGLVINLLQAISIVLLVLWLFLGAKASLVVSIAIPLTLASVFGLGLLVGQTINRITLFALILSLGLLVDNATVVIENAVRHINLESDIKKTKKEAVIAAVDEVGVGLLMSTITTLFAFFPMAFVTGMMGPYMGPIPFFVPAALIVSLIIAFTINPFLASQFLNARSPQSGNSNFLEKYKFNQWMDKYKNFLHNIFKNQKLRKKILVITVVAFVFSILLPVFGIVKFRMLPKADREQFYVYLDYPVGTDINKNGEITSMVEDYLLKEPTVLSVQSFVGTAPVIDFNGLFKGTQGRVNAYQATLKVNLSHHNDRGEKSEEIVQRLRPKIYQVLGGYPDVSIKLIEDPPGPPVLATVLLKVQGNDYNKLEEISYDVQQMLEDTHGVEDIDTSMIGDTTRIILMVDREKATRAGVNMKDAAYSLQVALQGANIAVLHNNQKQQEYVFVQFDKQYRDQIEDLSSIYLSNSIGRKIPLSEIAVVDTTTRPDILYSDGRKKTIYIFAEMGARSVTYAAIDMIFKLRKYKLPGGSTKIDSFSLFGTKYIDTKSGNMFEINWGGEWELTLEVFRDLGSAMLVAIFLVYIVLVAQFHSFRVPLIIMGTIPLALIGVLPGFAVLGLVTGIYFNATSMIGVIALAGIVVNNAIIFVEYLNGLRNHGLTVEEALVVASSTRLRPIVLTSVTTILGSFTIVGDPVWAGLAWSIIFGIFVSTLLTLIIFPILYYTFQRQEWVRGIRLS